MRRGYMQGFEVFAPRLSKFLVNRRSNEVVNIASTKMMKKLFAGSASLRGAKRRSNPESKRKTGLLRSARNDVQGLENEFHHKPFLHHFR